MNQPEPLLDAVLAICLLAFALAMTLAGAAGLLIGLWSLIA